MTAVEQRDLGQPGPAERLAARGPHADIVGPHDRAPWQDVCGKERRAVGVADLDLNEIVRLVESPESPLGHPATHIVKRGRSALIVKTSLLRTGCPTSTAYKRCGSKTWQRRLTRGMQRPRARRNFHLGHQLLRQGIATARPLLAMWPRWQALFDPGYLATEWLEDAVPIDAFLRRAAALPDVTQRALLRETADRVGRLVGTLHARGFAHRDLKATNLLIRERSGRIEAFVIDLDGVSVPLFLTRRTRMSNLARLLVATHGFSAITHSLRRRALSVYLASTNDPAPWKAVWRELQELSRIRRAQRVARIH